MNINKSKINCEDKLTEDKIKILKELEESYKKFVSTLTDKQCKDYEKVMN